MHRTVGSEPALDFPNPRTSNLQFDPENLATDDDSSESAEDKELLKAIADNFSSKLYKWDTFPLTLPAPKASAVKIKPTDLLKFPKFKDELDDLAFEQGRPKRLNEQQLKQVRAQGAFDIQSAAFPDQKHRWQLSRLLQKGYENGRKSLRSALAFALKLIIVFAKDRFNGKTFSLVKAAKTWLKIPKMLVDILIGWPNNDVVEFDKIIETERFKFIVAHLKVPEGRENVMNEFRNFITTMKMENQGTNNISTREKYKSVLLLYQYTVDNDGNQIPIDLRLQMPSIVSELQKILPKLIADQRKVADHSWFRELRNSCLTELLEQGLERGEIEQICNQRVSEEFIRRMFEAINNSEQIISLGEGIGDLIIRTYKYNEIVEKCAEDLSNELKNLVDQTRADLSNQYPIRSLIGRWMRRQIRDVEQTFRSENEWKLYQTVLAELEKMGSGFQQYSYLISRDLMFMQTEYDRLYAELSSITVPTRTFHWQKRIWFPRNFIVTRFEKDTKVSSRVEPVRFTKGPYENTSTDYESNVRYEMEKNTYYSYDTKYLFWRWVSLGYRYFVWTSNAIYYMLYHVPMCSCLGFRAFVSPAPFYPSYTVNRNTGVVHKSNKKTQSFVSRLRALWRHIHKARARFEDTPDRGFLGKSVTRPLNMFWNYIVKGAFGTVILCLIFPALCITVPTVSVILGITSPIWMLGGVLAYYLFTVFIYDKDSPQKRKLRHRSFWSKTFHRHVILPIFDWIIFRIGILGICQPVFALVFACVICPVTSILVVILAGLRHGIRSTWDLATFQILIKPFGRLPATDSFVARRVAGPGLSRDFFYQISAAQALAIIECQIELDELDQYERSTQNQIRKPTVNYRNRISTIFGPFGGTLNSSFSEFSKLQTKENQLIHDLSNLVQGRKRLVTVDVPYEQRSLVRLTARDLAFTKQLAGTMLSQSYGQRVIGRMEVGEEQFWRDKDLEFRDWNALGELMFEKVFGSKFLEPLEETEKRFQLTVHHIDMKEYLDQLISAEHREDLDNVTPTQGDYRTKFTVSLPSVSHADFMSTVPNYRFAYNLSDLADNFNSRPVIDDMKQLMAFIDVQDNEDNQALYGSDYCKRLFSNWH